MTLDTMPQSCPPTLPAPQDWSGASTIELTDPADRKRTMARYATATTADAQRVLDLARQGFAAWSALTVNQRCDLLASWLLRIEADAEQLAGEMTDEQGKPLAESRAEIGKSLREARQMLGFARQHGGQTLPGRTPGWTNTILRRPRGVVLAITPWNFPVLTPLRKLVPALATGNAVILKPSEYTPAAAMRIVRAAEGILPENTLTLVNGAGDVAATLTASRNIDAISFTGSVATGRKIGAVAGENLVPVSMELGGKNAAIVDDVADLDAALDAITGAAMQCAGQRCTAISRVILHDAIFEPACKGLAERLNSLTPGPGRAEGTTLGPITTQAQLDRIIHLVRAAELDGAEVLTGGHRLSPEAAPDGLFFAPSLLASNDPRNPANREEIFGPVLTLSRYHTDDEALSLANATRYGLTSAIFTDRLDFANRALRELQTGMIHVNHGTAPDDNMPFVGIRDSGLGTGSVGPSTLDFYTTEHAAYTAG
ncbi:aldehyde dehydrogenase family protein [Mameliella sediminis]|uniref:aldehyde dehydrogenase family protein n=1 Tax=Mameliella sediminis TaxID=2836866 RepID=UPI001C487244|nr:aldehyde dehydrogenase family protein [Mameliella sediminis]MBV7395824.1 aldehyde dehydrogenase family protein [Mameliella sediminis]